MPAHFTQLSHVLSSWALLRKPLGAFCAGEIGGGPGIRIVGTGTGFSGPSLGVGAQEKPVVGNRRTEDFTPIVIGLLTLV